MVNSVFMCVFACIVSTSWCDLTPFQKDIENFLPVQSEISQKINEYLSVEKEPNLEIFKLAFRHAQLQLAMHHDKLSFISNLFYNYLLIKSMTSDLEVLSQLVSTNTSKDDFLSNWDPSLLPNGTDLVCATDSLIWTQATSDIDQVTHRYYETSNLPVIHLTAKECYDLGVKSYTISNYEGIVYWMKKAMNKFQIDDNLPGKVKSMEYIAYGLEKQGMSAQASEIDRQLLEINSNNTKASRDIKLNKPNVGKLIYNHYVDDSRVHAKMCRGEHNKSIVEESKLFCRYYTNGNPYLLLQPAKEEEMNLDPRVVVYHDVISDKEIEIMKKLSLSKLHRSKLAVVTTRNPRVSKTAWLTESMHESVTRFSQRIADITGLSLETTEKLQIAHYGVGGFYHLHPDFFDNPKLCTNGDRIATWLSYIHEVGEGGFTVFPKINTIIKPEKGSAVFWHNLYRNGTGNWNTVHAACPVLFGTKWIVTKWFRGDGQMFLRPCNLQQCE